MGGNWGQKVCLIEGVSLFEDTRWYTWKLGAVGDHQDQWRHEREYELKFESHFSRLFTSETERSKRTKVIKNEKS